MSQKCRCRHNSTNVHTTPGTKDRSNPVPAIDSLLQPAAAYFSRNSVSNTVRVSQELTVFTALFFAVFSAQSS